MGDLSKNSGLPGEIGSGQPFSEISPSFQNSDIEGQKMREIERFSDKVVDYFFPPHTLKRVGKIIHPHIYSLFFWLSLPILCAHEMHRKTKENFPIHKTGYHKIFLLFYLYTNICIFRVWNCFSSQKFSTIKTSIYHYK